MGLSIATLLSQHHQVTAVDIVPEKVAAMQYQDIKYAGYYNVGPDDVDCFQTGALVDLFVSKWGDGMKWVKSRSICHLR